MKNTNLYLLIRCILLSFAALSGTQSAHAVPSFARQTGLECTSCHVSWPELTTVGRKFKLNGYTLMKTFSGNRPLVSLSKDGPPPQIPLAAFVQMSVTHTQNTSGADPSNFPRNDGLALQQTSLFYAGRITDHFGAFVQLTDDGIAHHSGIDNTDLRYANRLTTQDIDLIYGLTVNNNPTVSDIYNTTPTWGYPFASSSVAVAPNAITLIDGGLAQQVVGLGGYLMFNKTVHAEVAAYRTANRALSVFRAGVDPSTAAALDGYAPYWRLGLQHEWDEGQHSIMVGTFGLRAKKFPAPDSEDPSGPSDKFRDRGIDGQYQYVTDRHRVGIQLNWVKETQNLDATFPAGGSSNPSVTLKTFKARLGYYYDTKYGINLGYFSTHGDRDDGLYNLTDPNTGEPVAVIGSVNGSPNTNGYIIEFNWLPERDRRFMLQYTGYHKFNGARTNYDGLGRNASDNNTLYLLAWFLF
jgi:hypothetical protein